jgi:ubiquinone/menaquinone biosynthesis C-methylase UbiE
MSSDRPEGDRSNVEPAILLEPRHHKITRLIQHHWNSRAANFDEELEHGMHSEAQRQAWLEVLARLAGNLPQRILDVGCGTGVLTILFAQLGHRVTGIDIAPRMLDRARVKAQDAGVVVEFRHENAGEVSDSDGSYDLVVARHVVWTLPDPAQAVGEWRRLLRPGGCLAVVEGQWWTDGPKAESPSLRKTLVAFLRATRNAVSHGARPAQWGAVLGRLLALGNQGALNENEEARYQEAHRRLPFYGGPSAAQLAALLEFLGLRDVIIEPLMSAVLWGKVPPHPRYLAVGRR